MSVNRAAFRSTGAPTGRYFSKIGIMLKKYLPWGINKEEFQDQFYVCFLIFLGDFFLLPATVAKKVL